MVRVQSATIQMEAIEKFFDFHLLFSMLYKVVLIFMSVDETDMSDHLNKSY